MPRLVPNDGVQVVAAGSPHPGLGLKGPRPVPLHRVEKDGLAAWVAIIPSPHDPAKIYSFQKIVGSKLLLRVAVRSAIVEPPRWTVLQTQNFAGIDQPAIPDLLLMRGMVVAVADQVEDAGLGDP